MSAHPPSVLLIALPSSPRAARPLLPAAKEKARRAEMEGLREAARRGDTRALCRLGEIYKRGEGDVRQDAAEAARWYRRAAELGDPSAQNQLGDLLCALEQVAEPMVAQPHETEAAAWWRKAAVQGCAQAQYSLACALAEVAPDEAVGFYRAAAAQGHADAQHRLALCLEAGIGAERELAEAALMLQRAAEQACVGAQYRLALALADGGFGLPRNDCLAVRWLQRAAKRGNADAMCRLGACYEQGRGLAPSDAEALRWYRKAAAAGSALGAARVGFCFARGSSKVAQDMPVAEQWYRAAADKGLAEAQHWLALRRLEEGEELEAAALMLAQAAQGGYEPALASLAEHAHVRAVAATCCIGCGATKRLHACRECEIARFCGKECRQRMWPTHEVSCKEWRGAA